MLSKAQNAASTIDLVLDHVTENTRKAFGGYNDLPPNWKPCSPDEFWGRFMTYSWVREEFRQMIHKRGKFRVYKLPQMIQAHLFFYADGAGLAMVHNYNYDRMAHDPPLLFKFARCEAQNGECARGI